jgi:two-component system CheB/CheR fusion protein
LQRIFEAFHQEDQDVARTAGGLGLGLALTKGLIDLHCGSIVAHSKGPGEGSEFEIRLPLVSHPAPSSVPPPPSTQGVRKILIVEDNVDAAEMLTELLRVRGHEVSHVGSGKQALSTLENERYDVVFCDLGLPVMDGFEVASAIRNDEALKDVTLVALTGYGQPQDKEKALQAGFHHHLVKPIELSLLEEVLATVAPTA